ncbi:type IV secretory system conjugative DNA transfer family protein [Candidatus Kuenenbacteria bacterium]|nr:type IV secretory system conjugative DNA transfer family protein [Candidatus Kuenenbacteria bacterium]
MPSIEFDTSVNFGDPLMQMGLGLLFLIFLVIIAVFVLRYFLLGKNKVSKAFDRKIILVTVPKQTGEEKQGPPNIQQIQEKIGIMETLFSTIAGITSEKGLKAWFFGHKDIFSFELVVLKGKIHFFIAMPEHLQEYTEEQIQAQFPHAFIEEMPDYNMFKPKGFIKAVMMKSVRSSFLPIKTYKKMEADPLNSLTNALSKIDEEDGAVIQIVMKSARPGWRTFGPKVASKMQQGKKFEDAIREVKGGVSKVFSEVGKSFKSKSPEQNSPDQLYKLTPQEEEMVKGIEEKSSKAGADVNIRIVVSSENQARLDGYLSNVANAFNQYNVYKYGNAIKDSDYPFKKIINDFIYRNFCEKRSFVLNTEELASLYHFPIPLVNETPNIKWLDARKAPAPQNVPKEGLLMGHNVYRGRKTEIRINRDARRRHMYTIGQTGTGKSWFIEGMIMQDIANGEGCCYIDPHGDAIDAILKRIPKERAEDVVILDPGDVSRPIGLNLLEFKTQEEKTFAINEIMAILDKLYDLKATGGPMFEAYFKNAAALIMADPESGSTLLEISRVLADDDFRKYKLSKCKDQLVKDFWEKEAQKAGGEASLANMVPYITSKMSPFITNDFIRPIISQQNSTIDFADVMNSKKILLVKLSKGKIGEINANLLGMIVIGKLLMAALGRADMPEDDREDFYLYIDEFQNFLTDSMEIILSEARKYRLCLSIAHQYIGQLVKSGDTKFKDAIFGNVGTKCSFRIGVDDAENLSKEFAGVFSENDFLNVPKFNCYVKLLIENANPPGFNLATLNLDTFEGLPKKNPELAEAIKKLSKLKFGKDPEIIAMEIKERQAKTF